MESHHWQIILNFLPMVGTTISTFVLIAGLLIKNDKLKLTAIILILFMSVSGFIIHKIGEKTEQGLYNDPTINHTAFVAFEETAQPAFFMHSVAGALSLVALALYNKRKKAFNIIGIVILSLSIPTIGLMSYAGYLDGKVKHVEINTVFPINPIGAVISP